MWFFFGALGQDKAAGNAEIMPTYMSQCIKKFLLRSEVFDFSRSSPLLTMHSKPATVRIISHIVYRSGKVCHQRKYTNHLILFKTDKFEILSIPISLLGGIRIFRWWKKCYFYQRTYSDSTFWWDFFKVLFWGLSRKRTLVKFVVVSCLAKNILNDPK